MPKTFAGKWSVGLIIVMFVLFVIGSSLAGTLYESVPSGDTVFADLLNRPALAGSMLAGFGAGIASLVTGLIGIIRKEERALLVFLSTLIGAGVTVFLIAEFIFS